MTVIRKFSAPMSAAFGLLAAPEWNEATKVGIDKLFWDQEVVPKVKRFV